MIERPGHAIARFVASGELREGAARALRDQLPELVSEHDRVYSIRAIDRDTVEVKIRKIESVTYTITDGKNAASDHGEINEIDL